MQWFIYGLTIVFAVAKLIGAIDWSWWSVFSPVALYWLFGLSLFIGYLVAVRPWKNMP